MAHLVVWVGLVEALISDGPKSLDMLQKTVSKGNNAPASLVFVVGKMV